MNITLNISEDSFKSTQLNRVDGRWTPEEHELFLEGLNMYGRNWKRIESIVTTRTGSQIRSHAQKFFQKISNKRKGDLNQESSYGSELKGEQSSSTLGSQNQPEFNSFPSIQGMISELKTTLNFIKQSGINPLNTFSHYFFEIISHPEELINNNFYGYFVDVDWSTPLKIQENSMDESKIVSFQPYDPSQNHSSICCQVSN